VKSKNTESNKPEVDFAALLQSAVEEPGNVRTSYSMFWNYSLGNQMLALGQCISRGIDPGPIATFNGWRQHGRFVKKGEKAIVLCMPVASKKAITIHEGGKDQGRQETITFTRFMRKPNWFVLSQTDGDEYKPENPPGFDFKRALKALDIERVEFAILDGNCHGYADKRTVAVSPVAPLPERTLLHEIAHVLLGHTAEGPMTDSTERTPCDIRELEAEATGTLCCAALGIGDLNESRRYIQSWYRSKTIPEPSARKIFQAVDTILKAGRENDKE
jgi:N-terminal domain of anti-restriction factor ArdC